MKVLHVYSGGLDSTVLLAQLLKEKNEVRCLNFYYGSNHNEMERNAAQAITKKYNVQLDEINLDFIKEHFKSSLLSGAKAIPEGHYQAENMRSTVVPFRNGIMLSIAVGFAESIGMEAVSIASHAGDHYIYPDCRPQFNTAMEDAVREGTEKRIKLLTPFFMSTKTDIAKLGAKLKAPMFLSYSCYRGGQEHCGTCGACNERKEAFKEAGIVDETGYTDVLS
jgi:7-cyano-7-deazaguanine synthase